LSFGLSILFRFFLSFILLRTEMLLRSDGQSDLSCDALCPKRHLDEIPSFFQNILQNNVFSKLVAPAMVCTDGIPHEQLRYGNTFELHCDDAVMNFTAMMR
jgi:hypothetical protein